MPQICTAVSEEHFTTILARAENEGKSKARIAADLISYALADNGDEAARLKREIELKDALIEQLRDENSFMKSSFATQTDMTGRLLHLLAEGVRDDVAVAGDNGTEDHA